MELLVVLTASVVIPVLMILFLIRRQTIRPRDTDQVQITWAENRQLREESLGCQFWRFIAIMELVAIIVLLLT